MVRKAGHFSSRGVYKLCQCITNRPKGLHRGYAIDWVQSHQSIHDSIPRLTMLIKMSQPCLQTSLPVLVPTEFVPVTLQLDIALSIHDATQVSSKGELY